MDCCGACRERETTGGIALMEAFWGKLKYEWLEARRFRTREEARAAVFEYVEIFYNSCRFHASNGYLTPQEYWCLGKAG